LATAAWLWRLAPSNTSQSGRVEVIAKILKLSSGNPILQEKTNDKGVPLSIEDNLKSNPFFNTSIKGFASTGTYYNTNKPAELAYIINFFKVFLEPNKSSGEGFELLGKDWDVTIKETYDLVDPNKKDGKENVNKQKEDERLEKPIKIKLDKQKKDERLEKQSETDKQEFWLAKYQKKLQDEDATKVVFGVGENAKTVAVRNALLYWIDPEHYEPIISKEYKEKIEKTFKDEYEKDKAEKLADNIDKCLYQIKDMLIEKYGQDIVNDGFYSDGIKDLWLSGIDFGDKNTILYGVPGTGKTYQTLRTIKNRVKLDNLGAASTSIEYSTLVQFHPSYGYEDFIDGVKPIGTDNSGNMKFGLVNGAFKKMCIQAFKELVRAKNATSKKETKAKSFYFVADEINRAELSRVFGELLLCLEEDKRLRFDGNELQGAYIKTQNAALWEKEHAVVVMKKDKKVVDVKCENERLEYISDGDEYYFGVPENLYFIGTMNDIDRSVDSFDMALRRRFVWKHYSCDYGVLVEHYDCDVEDSYIKACKALNEHITSAKGFDLGESYELGHSYFMTKNKKINNSQMSTLWEEKIAPLLKEYLRTTYSESEIKKHLAEAKKIFALPKKNSNGN